MPFQLPTLQTDPGIVTPQPANAMMQAQKMKSEMARTGIAQQNADTQQGYLNLAGQKFEEDKETREFQKSMRAMEFAFQNSSTPEEFASSYKEMTGNDVKVKFSGKNITMQFPDKDGNMMEVSGPSEVVADAVAGGMINAANARTGMYSNMSQIASNAANQYSMMNYMQPQTTTQPSSSYPAEYGYGYGR